ncbi:MAG: hypothetical protein AMQ22_00934 [Candidatus Methanofastidiosum methylothiophilum]|jgi:hypothetical protein|uniref:Terminase-like family protein n=1 Tax=Candidatus Methanofastidiosum methylothiophilum TaxID=1705564 RepID=A0A150J4N5_9EURY|nr:MAG: hypothetical protein AMQ22_00934 [Candidatus Methanofastidiosum methylthiophilus]
MLNEEYIKLTEDKENFINYVVSPTFAKVHKDRNRFIFIMGPVSSGKSTGCIFHCFLNAQKQVPDRNGIRRSRYAIIRNTYPQLKTTTIKTWINWFKDKIKITYDIPVKGHINWALDDGTTLDIELVFMAIADSQDIEKLRSLELTGCHINEAGQLDREVFDMIKNRINRYPIDNTGSPCAVDPFIICDYNAVSTDHWLYKLAEEDRPEGFSFYRQPPAVLLHNGKYILNPDAENIKVVDEYGRTIHPGVTEDYYLTACMGTDPDMIYVNLMNNYGETRHGKPVYKDYDDSQHLATTSLRPLAGVPLVIGMDQGLKPAAVVTQQAADGTVLVLDEIVTDDCSIQEFCQDLLLPLINTKYKDYKNNYYVVCDPATVRRSMNDSKAGTDILKENGVVFRTAKTNSFIARKEAVTHFLRLHNKFKVDRSCFYIRKGFLSEYHYEPIRSASSDKFREVPEKNIYSNPHDALQYACMEYYHGGTRKRPKIFKKRYKAGSDIGGY